MSHYDIHVGDVIKYPEMVMARTVESVKKHSAKKLLFLRKGKIKVNSKFGRFFSP